MKMFRLGVLKANGKTYFRVGHCNKTNKTITKKKKKKIVFCGQLYSVCLSTTISYYV